MQRFRSPEATTCALTIAGSDSGGCAGIQADLRTFAALGVHGSSAITAVTAQNTLKVYDSCILPLASISRQIDAVVEDMGAAAVKTGMLPSRAVIELVASKAVECGFEKLVVDPVMLTTGGDSLIESEAVSAMVDVLFPKALVVTPNIPEAEALTGISIGGLDGMRESARQILDRGPRSVIVKGGHLESTDSSVDLFFDGREFLELRAPRIPTPHTHGSGCTFSAAIAAGLAMGLKLPAALELAKDFVTAALRHSYPVGKGNGPLGHFEAGQERRRAWSRSGRGAR